MSIQAIAPTYQIQQNQFSNTATLEMIQALFKDELHIHLGGAWPLDFLEKVAVGEDLITLNRFKERIASGINYSDVFTIFSILGKIVNSNELISQGAFALCQKFHEDNVTYAEVRTGLKRLDGTLEDYLQSVIKGLEKGCQYYSTTTPILLSIRRDDSLEHAKETIELALKYRESICGIDISGDSTKGNLENLTEAIQLAKEQGLPFVLHLGESDKEDAKGQLRELQVLEPKRIGHGVHLGLEALNYIKENQIPLEICLTSAQLTKMISDKQEHPGLELYLQNHPVCFSTDDPAVFSTTLSEEFYILANSLNLSIEDIQILLENSKSMRLI
ncbi:MAG: Cyclic adenylate deaminase [Chlamydiales bacterium]|nr:Cyclic adenylate deaminase [Chlamydiales bacterium]